MKGSTKIFSDCAVVVSPTAKQLAEIAMHAAKNGERFLQHERPRIAMLSFSSQGSSTAIEAQIVQEALGIVHGNTTQNGVHDRGYVYDGELQLDAAIVPHVAASKAPDSPLSGTANVLIFPNLGAAKFSKICHPLFPSLGGGRIFQNMTPPFSICRAAEFSKM